MKNILTKVNKRNMAKAVMVALTVLSNCMVCFADTTETTTDPDAIANQITSPFISFLSVMITIVQVVGGYFILKGIMEFGPAIKNQDDSGTASAVKTFITGLLFIFSRLIIQLFGVSV